MNSSTEQRVGVPMNTQERLLDIASIATKRKPGRPPKNPVGTPIAKKLKKNKINDGVTLPKQKPKHRVVDIGDINDTTSDIDDADDIDEADDIEADVEADRKSTRLNSSH